jgi:hypothetical protein
MGYRIQYSRLDGTLSAVVTGKSTLAAAGCIARDIAAQAARESAGNVLIDLRWLEDRVGTLRALLSLPELRVAVLDLGQNDPHYVFSERNRLKYFHSLGGAMSWLRADEESPRGDRKAPTPGGTRARAPLEIYGG